MQDPVHMKKLQKEVLWSWFVIVQLLSLMSVKMISKFPVLDDYEDMWLLDCILISLLNQLSQSKVLSAKKAMKLVQDTVNPDITTHSVGHRGASKLRTGCADLI